MKIDRLYTLSQFIDELTLDFNESQSWMAEAYLAIHRYSEFLKQPLKKEMFICEVEMPIFPNRVGLENFEQILVDRYQDAKKKVIFDGEQIKTWGFEIDSIINQYKTIYDIAEATNGELKLKNIEL